jgi:hypothetical protein
MTRERVSRLARQVLAAVRATAATLGQTNGHRTGRKGKL